MNEEVTIPTLAKFECPRCKRQAVAEEGSQMLCQPCVNEFLARNVGMMEPVEERLTQQDVVPLPPVETGGGFVPGEPE